MQRHTQAHRVELQGGAGSNATLVNLNFLLTHPVGLLTTVYFFLGFSRNVNSLRRFRAKEVFVRHLSCRLRIIDPDRRLRRRKVGFS